MTIRMGAIAVAPARRSGGVAEGAPASIVAVAASMTLYVDAERLGRVRQIGRLHRLRRLADLELDVVVLKKIGGDRGFDGEIDVLRDVALSP